MTTIEARIATPAKRATASAAGKTGKTGSKAKGPSNKAETSEEFHTARVTKHDRILTLLSRREGATIPEMMETSGWQQHSVRGFLSGTVKKKLGFTLTSSKTVGDLRRYRIETKRGR
jgi:uncharacterized protein DUF3489